MRLRALVAPLGRLHSLRSILAFACALVLVLAGCLGGEGGDGTSTPTTTSTPTVSTPSPTPTTAPTEPVTPTPTPPTRPVGESFFEALPGPTAGGVAAVGHLTDDELFDVYVAGPAGGKLYVGKGNGAFEDATAAKGLACDACALKHVAIGDVDEDGLQDLALLASTGLRLHVSPGPNGAWPEVAAARGLAGVTGDALAFADFENDGDLDLAVASAASPLKLFANDGEGRFGAATEVPGAVGRAFTFLYVDDDAFLDLVVAADDGLRSFRNVNGTFADTTAKAKFPAGIRASSVFAMDYDNNQALDLLLAGPGGLHVLKNLRIGGAFADRSTALGLPTTEHASAIALDFDNDGWLDLLGLTSEGFTLLLNAEGESFAPPQGATGLPTGSHSALAGGDFDRDGRPDALALKATGRATLLANRHDAGPYFTLHLKGNESTFSGVGAKVSLSSGTAIMYRQVGGGASPTAAVPADPFFGLGADLVDKYTLAIKWPSGILQFETIEKERVVNRQLEAKESASEAPWGEC